MRHFKNYMVAGIFLASCGLCAQKVVRLKPIRSVATAIAEPSDICFNAKSGTFFIVSDSGILFETDHDAKILRQVSQKDADFEAVYSDEKNVYAVDETHRNIFIYDIDTFKVSRMVTIPYGGGKNKGYEALTYNKSKNGFAIITEKDPVYLFELDNDFKTLNRIDLSKIATDISAAAYHDNFLWLLSDEDMMLLKLDPNTYEVVAKWSLPVINPEGFAFDQDGNLMVTCDDMQHIYYFNNPEKS